MLVFDAGNVLESIVEFVLVEEEDDCSVEKRLRRPDTACETLLGLGTPQVKPALGVDVPELGDDVS